MQLVRDWLSKLNLWLQMALAVSVGFLTLFLAFSLLAERVLRDSSERLLTERQIVANMIASQIDQWLLEEIEEMKRANIRTSFEPMDPRLEIEADELANIYSQLDEFSPGFSFLDSSGRVVLSRPDDLYLPGTDLSHLPHISLALERHDATVSDPFLHPLRNQAVAAMTVQIYNGDRFLGLLSGMISVDSVQLTAPLELAIATGRTSHAILVDRHGRAINSTFDLPVFLPGEHAAFYRRAMTIGEPTVETVPSEFYLPNAEEGQPHIMAFAPLQSAPWGVAVGGEESEIFASIRRLRMGQIVIATIAMGVVLGATLISARWLVRPIQRTTQAAQRIAQGDLDTSITASESKEVRIMALALERMRIRLLRSIEDLTSWNETLEKRVQERTVDLRQQQAFSERLLRRIITTQEGERARIARELHDGLGQALTAIEFSMDLLGKSLPPTAGDAKERLEKVSVLTEEAMIDLRYLIGDLRPGILDQLGLIPAIGWIGDRTLRPLDISVAIETFGLTGRLPDEIETTLFRIAQEAMHNVARHSRAEHLTIHLEQENGEVKLTLIDDGIGWDSAETTFTYEDSKGFGLANMRERALLVGGRLKIESTVGRGTTVRAIVPIPITGSTDSTVSTAKELNKD
jgi:signal transduction histidine kinase